MLIPGNKIRYSYPIEFLHILLLKFIYLNDLYIFFDKKGEIILYQLEQ